MFLLPVCFLSTAVSVDELIEKAGKNSAKQQHNSIREQISNNFSVIDCNFNTFLKKNEKNFADK